MKPTRSLLLFAGSLAALCFSYSAQAADLTWDNGGGTGNWNTGDANFGGLWANGNTAVFGGTAGSTVTINAVGISATGVTFNVNNDIIAQSGGNNLTLTSTGLITVGSTLTATINAPLAGSVGLDVEGGGTLNLGGVSTIDGGGDGSKGLIVGSTTSGNIVNLTSGGTMSTVGTNRRSIFIGSTNHVAGSSTTNNNVVNITTPGTLLAPSFNVSGNGGRVTIGYASDNNELNVSNGAYITQQNGGGTNTWEMGTISGADGNILTLSGTGSTINFGSNHALVVGVAGSNNEATVSAGGLFITRRFNIGLNGGSSNSVTITGTGSTATTSTTATPNSNSLFEMGSTAGSNSNYMSIEAGGAYNFYGSGATNRYFSIGRLGDNNYLAVTGSNSSMNVTFNEPVVVGGTATGTAGATLTEGGFGNHLDINAGGAVNLTNTSLYLMGSTSTGNTSLNLGNGTGIGTLTVGSTSGGAHGGVWLKNASGRVNFDSGRLIAGAAGDLVSGTGSIVLNGVGYISTAFASTISTAVSGGGSLTKEGSGTLTLSSAATSYTGNTTVNAGTLTLGSGVNLASTNVIVGNTLASTAVLNVSASGLTLGGGQTLQGSGSITGNVTLNSLATLAPGNSIESLAMAGNLAMNNGSTFAYEVDSSAALASGADFMKVTGNVTLDSTSGNKVYLTLSDFAVTDVAFAAGTTFSLMNYTGSLVGGPDDGGGFFYGTSTSPLGEGATFTAGLNGWKITYGDRTGGVNFIGDHVSGKFINLTAGPLALTAVPEPGSLLALGCLVGSGVFLRSRRRRA